MEAVDMFLSIQKVGILLLPKTHFAAQNYIKIQNYTTNDTNHPEGRAHAGSALNIRKGLKRHELTEYEKDHIQATNRSIEY
jgi:hypothetical protein